MGHTDLALAIIEMEVLNQMADARLIEREQRLKNMYTYDNGVPSCLANYYGCCTPTEITISTPCCKEDNNMNKKDIRFSTIVSALQDHFNDRYSKARQKEERRLEEEYRNSEEFTKLIEMHTEYKRLSSQIDELPFYKWATHVKLVNKYDELAREIYKQANKSSKLYTNHFSTSNGVELGTCEYTITIELDKELLPKKYTQDEIEARLYLMAGWEDLSFNELVEKFV